MANRGQGGGRRGGARPSQSSQIGQPTLEVGPSDPTQVESFVRDEVVADNAGMFNNHFKLCMYFFLMVYATIYKFVLTKANKFNCILSEQGHVCPGREDGGRLGALHSQRGGVMGKS